MDKKVWVLTASILASSMAFIDGSALNVAIPSIQAAFNASGSDILWILNGYLLMLAAFILPGGALGDKLGRKKVFMAGIVIFLLASIACGFSWNSSSLILARFIQGIGGAFMIPGSLSLINASVADEERGKAIGIWSSVTTMVMIAGPVLGGILADLHFWRGVFLINLPLGIVALLVLAFKVPESRNESDTGPIDYVGALLLAIGLGALSYGLLKIPDLGIHAFATGGCVIAGVVILLAFIFHQWKSRHPMLPLNLFASSAFTGSNLLTLCLYGALSAGLFFLSLNMIQAQSYSQTQAGLTGLPFALLLTVFSPKVGSYADKLGPRLFLVIGPAIAGLGFFFLSLPKLTHGPGDYWLAYFPGLLVLGLGMTLTVTPLTTTVLASTGQQYSGTASGINNAISRIAGVLAIAAVGAFALISFQYHLESRVASLALPADVHHELVIESKKLAATIPPHILPANIQNQLKRDIRESFVDTYQWVMLICAALSLFSALFAFIFIRKVVEPERKQVPYLAVSEEPV